MMRMRKFLGLFCAALIVFLAACTGAAPSDTTTIRMGWSFWPGDFTLLIAQKKGFFRAHGLDVQTTRFDSASQEIPNLAGAELDGGIFSMSDLLLANNMIPLKAVFVADDGGTLSIISTPDITNVNDLRGKRIGFNMHSTSEFFVANMLKTRHMTSKDVFYMEMFPDEVSVEVPSLADAALVWEPYTSQAVQDGKVIIYQSPSSSALMPHLITFRKTFVEQHPDLVRSFIAAWQEAVSFRAFYPAESTAIMSVATGYSADQLAKTTDMQLYSIIDNDNLFAKYPGQDPTSIYFIAATNRDFLVTNGYLTTQPDLKDLLDASFFQN